MSADRVAALRAQIGGARDGALLRFSLGQALASSSDWASAVTELREAVRFDPHYSAAWKLLGKTLEQLGQTDGAKAAYREGIGAAGVRGDKQAEKEMRVFLRRMEKGAP